MAENDVVVSGAGGDGNQINGAGALEGTQRRSGSIGNTEKAAASSVDAMGLPADATTAASLRRLRVSEELSLA